MNGISGVVRVWGLPHFRYMVEILYLSGSMTRKQLHRALDKALDALNPVKVK